MTEKINKIFFHIANWICIFFAIVIVALLMITFIGRYFLNSTPSWSEELALFSLTWVGLFSSCIAEEKGTHIRLSFIDRYFPPALLRVFGIIRYFLKLVFFGLMLYYGIRIFVTTKQLFASVNISYRWQILPGIFTAAFCLIFQLMRFRQVMTDKHLQDKDLEREALLSESEGGGIE